MISMNSNYTDDIKQNLTVYIKATIHNSAGSPQTRVITNDNIIDRGFSYTDSTSQEGSLEIGSCIVNQFTMTIHNPTEYNNFVYAGADVTLEIGRKIAGTMQYVQKGIYYVISDGYYNDVITLTCYDKMILLDKPFDASSYYDSYGYFRECTLGELFSKLVNQADITTDGIIVLNNENMVIKKDPQLDKMTCRQLLYYICQCEGCYARFNRFGKLELKWHKLGVGRTDADIDDTVYVIDSYTEGSPVLVAGCKISGMQDRDDYKTCADDNYTLIVDGNPLISKANYLTVANTIQAKIVNKYVGPLSCRIAPNELLEAGDKVLVVGKQGTTYARSACITNLEYTLGEPEYISCGAETLEQNKTNRGISQIELDVNKAKKKTRGISKILRVSDGYGRIEKIKYFFDDDTTDEVTITYDSDGNLIKIGGTDVE